MCRFICYRGRELLLSDLLYRPAHSLILQSYRSRERSEPLNGDGFGVGWYAPEITDVPGVFTSLTPAWSNQNLRSLAEHVTSPCFFGHIRAATPGLRVSEANCHPFQYGRYLWMHNGAIAGYQKIRRRLRGSLPDALCDAIQGTTDSEHAFMLFLTLLPSQEECSAEEIGKAMANTIARLEALRTEVGVDEPSFLNFAVTDGRSVVAARYVSDGSAEPASLYYSAVRRFVADGTSTRLVCGCPSECAVIVASERLTEDPDDWVRVAPNHLVAVAPDLSVSTEAIRV